tara:strand:- start:106 stop:366 length:261 start_codon:yes stop_codon:yes gene_type:complete
MKAEKNYLGTNCPIRSSTRIARDIPVGPPAGSLVKQTNVALPHRYGLVEVPGKLSVRIKYIDTGSTAWISKEYLETIIEEKENNEI